MHKVTACISLAALLVSNAFLPVQAKPEPKYKSATNTENIYQRAQSELPEEIYVLYRVIDRVARANGLDDHPWRVGIVDKYDINAFATEVNLVAVFSGMLDQVAGDTSAAACLIGHEAGHHINRHQALSKAQIASKVEQMEKEVQAEVDREVAKTSKKVQTNSILGAVFGVNTSGFSQRSIAKAQERVEKIQAEKKQQLISQSAELSRQQEREADEAGYKYSVQAGFEPQGCLRLLDMLSRTEGAEFDTTHPSVPKRIEAIKALMVKYPPQTLVAAGKAKLTATKPLTYSASKDGETLRVNSRFGSSQNDLDRLFSE